MIEVTSITRHCIYCSKPFRCTDGDCLCHECNNAYLGDCDRCDEPLFSDMEYKESSDGYLCECCFTELLESEEHE